MCNASWIWSAKIKVKQEIENVKQKTKRGWTEHIKKLIFKKNIAVKDIKCWEMSWMFREINPWCKSLKFEVFYCHTYVSLSNEILACLADNAERQPD